MSSNGIGKGLCVGLFAKGLHWADFPVSSMDVWPHTHPTAEEGRVWVWLMAAPGSGWLHASGCTARWNPQWVFSGWGDSSVGVVLAPEHEDLNSHPLHLHKKLGVVAQFIITATERGRRDLLLSASILINKTQASERPLSKSRVNMGSSWEAIFSAGLWHPCSYTHISLASMRSVWSPCDQLWATEPEGLWGEVWRTGRRDFMTGEQNHDRSSSHSRSEGISPLRLAVRIGCSCVLPKLGMSSCTLAVWTADQCEHLNQYYPKGGNKELSAGPKGGKWTEPRSQ